MERKYGIVLKEKSFVDGLNRTDLLELFDMIKGEEVYPVEFMAYTHESSAMGFITPEAAEALDYDYETSGIADFIATILDDIGNESTDCTYSFKGISIWLSR